MKSKFYLTSIWWLLRSQSFQPSSSCSRVETSPYLFTFQSTIMILSHSHTGLQNLICLNFIMHRVSLCFHFHIQVISMLHLFHHKYNVCQAQWASKFNQLITIITFYHLLYFTWLLINYLTIIALNNTKVYKITSLYGSYSFIISLNKYINIFIKLFIDVLCKITLLTTMVEVLFFRKYLIILKAMLLKPNSTSLCLT